MIQLTVVAKIKAKAGEENHVHQGLRNLVEPTLAEEGCINYDLHRSVDDTSVFLFYENWISREAWEKHTTAEHSKAFQQEYANSLEVFEVLLLTPDKV